MCINRLIAVLGMHRGGTSAVTRGLGVMGVELGNNLLPVQEDNPKGFWEDIDIHTLNMEVLSALGVAWHYLAPVRLSDVNTLRKRGYVQRAIEVLDAKVSAVGTFGLKDPRLAKLLPFWREVFSQGGFRVSFVLSIRHPLSVSKSLFKRNGFDIEKSYLMWLGHIIEGLSGSDGYQRVIVDYDRLIESPDRELNRMASSLGLRIDAMELQRYKSEFIDSRLRHTMYSQQNLLLDENCPLLVKDAYAVLLDVATDRIKIDDELILKKIDHWKMEYAKLINPLILVDRLTTRVDERDGQLAERDAQLAERDAQLAERDAQLREIQSSRAWRFAMLLRGIRVRLAPPGSRREKIARWAYMALKIWRKEGPIILMRKIKDRIAQKTSNSFSDYQEWILNNEPGTEQLAEQRLKVNNFDYKPLISVVVPVWNTPAGILEQTIRSVADQTYDRWELCVADGNSNPETKKVLSDWAKNDRRIRIKFLDENKGIAINSNEALSLANGEFIAFLDHDDCLSPFALFEVVSALQQYPKADLIYSDEDLISMDGKKRFGPHFKPAFSPDLLRSINYITHLMVIRKTLGDKIGWLKNGYEGAQDYDLVLRVVEQAGEIVHIPKILYHWRHWSSSTTNTPHPTAAKIHAGEVGKKALKEHLERCGLNGSAEDGPDSTTYQVKYFFTDRPLVSIIILNRDQSEYLRKCIVSIRSKSTYDNYEIIIVENGSREGQTFRLYDELKKEPFIRIIEFKEPFNFSRANNFAASHASGNVLLFLNNDIEVISRDWLERMLEHALRKEVGLVGSKLYYPDNTIQHAGVILGIGGFAGHSHKHSSGDAAGYINRLRLIQNYSAVTGACLMIRRDVFYEVGGFDEQYDLALSDIDLCLKALSSDYLILWTPYAELYHHESKTRGYEDNEEKLRRFGREVNRFKQKWVSLLERGDECYNPNLTLTAEDFSLNPNPVKVSVRSKLGLKMNEAGH